MRIHVHGGDASATAASEAGIEGRHLAFREALIDGPAPAGVTDEVWIETRARHLSEAYGEDLSTMRAVSAEEIQMIDDLLDEEEIYFWFDRDLFCQVNLMFILARLVESGFEGSCTLVESHDGDPASLDHSIRHLSPEEIESYARAWNVYGSDDPGALEQLVGGELPEALGAAVRLHLERFPSRTSGLGRPEQRIVELIGDAGSISFKSLFPQFAAEEIGYGLGDAQVWTRLMMLASDPNPLIAIDGSEEPFESTMTLTELGKSVRDGRADAVRERDIDQWLGGIHLTPSNLWRYEEGVLRVER